MGKWDWCNDPYTHEREGRDAGRYERYDCEHREKMDNARWGSPESCDAAYARGYQEERRYQERQEELRREEEAAEQRAYERRMYERECEERMIEEAIEQQRYEQQPEPQYPEPPAPSESK